MDDSFADGERVTFVAPDSATWLKSQGGTSVSVVPGAATFTMTGTSAEMIIAYFTAAGAPIDLGVGQQLSVQLTFSFSGLTSTASPSPALRFGVLDSQGTRVTADVTSTGNNMYIGDTGYGLFTSFSSTASGGAAFDLKRRTDTAPNNVFNSAANWTTLAAGGVTPTFADATDYTLTYVIERLSATQTKLTAGVGGGTLDPSYRFSTIEESGSPLTRFDYFGWRMGASNFASAITFKNLTVEVGGVSSTPTPTPATPTPTPTPTATPSPTATPTASPTVPPGYVPDFTLKGFATLNGGTTGGAGGATVTVSTLTDLQDAAHSGTAPLVILVNGLITGTQSKVRVDSNKTILGSGAGAELYAVELDLANSSNIIIRNLKMSHVMQVPGVTGDLIHLENTRNVWVDHCELFNDSPAVQPDKDLYDGLLDSRDDSAFLTVSWTYFHDHWKGQLFGASNEDAFDRRATFHHNYYNNVNSRTPSYRHGTGHIYNSYYVDSGGINSRMGAVLRVEGNTFLRGSDPVTFDDAQPGVTEGFWELFDNQYLACTGSQPTVSTGTFVPPYAYALDSSADVPGIILAFAGVGKTDPLANLP